MLGQPTPTPTILLVGRALVPPKNLLWRAKRRDTAAARLKDKIAGCRISNVGTVQFRILRKLSLAVPTPTLFERGLLDFALSTLLAASIIHALIIWLLAPSLQRISLSLLYSRQNEQSSRLLAHAGGRASKFPCTSDARRR